MSVGNTLSVLTMIRTSLLYAYSVFDNLLSSTNMTGVYSAAILVVLVVRFILMPIVGSLRVGTGSDTASGESQKRGNRNKKGNRRNGK